MRQTSILYLQTKIFKHLKLNKMKNYLKTFKDLRKASPDFKPRFLTLDCPMFMINAFMPKTKNQ